MEWIILWLVLLVPLAHIYFVLYYRKILTYDTRFSLLIQGWSELDTVNVVHKPNLAHRDAPPPQKKMPVGLLLSRASTCYWDKSLNRVMEHVSFQKQRSAAVTDKCRRDMQRPSVHALVSEWQGQKPVSWRDDSDMFSDNNRLCAAAEHNISILWHHVTWPQLGHVESNKECCFVAIASVTWPLSCVCVSVLIPVIKYNVIPP